MKIIEQSEYEKLRDRISYDPDSGTFFSKISNRKVSAGERIGFLHKNTGYVMLSVCGRHYKAHRVAFYLVFGWLPRWIDHANGIRSDNRIKNLREVTCSQNLMNMRASGGRSSVFKGVTKRPNGRWRANISIGGKNKCIGTFDGEVEAAYMYDTYSLEHHREYGRRNFLPLVR